MRSPGWEGSRAGDPAGWGGFKCGVRQEEKGGTGAGGYGELMERERCSERWRVQMGLRKFKTARKRKNSNGIRRSKQCGRCRLMDGIVNLE